MARTPGALNRKTLHLLEAKGIKVEDYQKQIQFKKAMAPVVGGQATAGLHMQQPIDDPEDQMSDEQILEGIKDRFDVLKIMTKSAIKGETRALVVSGPPGLGKSYTVEELMAADDPDEHHTIFIKGFSRATGVYKQLYNHREKNERVIFDDCDSVFNDAVALNLLKSASDTTDKRRISWGAETRMTDDDGEYLPSHFIYNGVLIFITNLDFDAMIASCHALSEHLKALVSRTHYMDLMIKTKRAYMLTCKYVVEKEFMLEKQGYSKTEQSDVMNFFTTNRDKFRELSLRMVIKIAQHRRNYPTNDGTWQRVASHTCFRTR